jgi:aminoglycoside phosphotransferase family enzyme/predicted kinase
MIKSDNLPPLIASLLHWAQKEYGAETVDLLETHISWVLLAGDYAYKIKKPVVLPFVDYGTLEARRIFCEKELALNSRYAPELYLETVPIGGSVETPLIGVRPAIEWAVEMGRFDDKWRLDHVCDRGDLTPALISDLVRTVADFHARAAQAPPESRFGDPAEILKPALENFEELRPLLPDDKPLLTKMEEWTRREWEQRRANFAKRKVSGYVRECHGDMHLGNIALLDGRPTPFDCIEFNEAFRWIDQANELAFIYEDLIEHHKPGLANWLISEWLVATGDFDILNVLPFYATYRALVRTKVAAIRGDTDEAHEYLTLASRFCCQRQGALAITFGLSGSGKTTSAVARLLSDQTANMALIRSDVERKRLFGLAPEDASNGAIYTPEATDRTYSHLEELAQGALIAGWSVIVDAAFLQRAQRDRFRALASGMNLPFAILACEASPDELRRRLRARRNDASEATVEVLESQMKWADGLTDEEKLLRAGSVGEIEE